MTEQSTQVGSPADHPKRPVGIFLITGILVLPMIFSWVLLRRGYGAFVRVLGFGWLCAFIVWSVHSRVQEGTAVVSVDKSAVSTNTTTGEAAQKTASVEETNPQEENETERPAISKWQYTEDQDQMRGTTIRYALLGSENRLDFAFPYGGGVRASIQLRESAGKLTVMLIVEKGIFICNDLVAGTIAAKFDNQPIQRYDCATATDGTSNITFIRPEKKFLKALRKAHHVVVETNFFQEGPRQMEFEASGLKW